LSNTLPVVGIDVVGREIERVEMIGLNRTSRLDPQMAMEDAHRRSCTPKANAMAVPAENRIYYGLLGYRIIG